MIDVLAGLTATQILVMLATWAGATACVNLLAHRSQVDDWCEGRPKLAAALKVCRGLGVDPWLIVQGVSLWLRGRLPDSLRKAIPVLLVLPLLGCSWLSQGDAGCEPDSTLLASEAGYVAEVLRACPPSQYDAPEDCPAFEGIAARQEQRRRAWVDCEVAP